MLSIFCAFGVFDPRSTDPDSWVCLELGSVRWGLGGRRFHPSMLPASARTPGERCEPAALSCVTQRAEQAPTNHRR